MTKGRAVGLASLALSIAGYIWIGYFTPRSNFVQLLVLFAVLFSLYALILRSRVLERGVGLLLAAGMALRIALLFMTPNLSDDYFRFVWDGLSVSHGLNPYLVTPSLYMDGVHAIPGADATLYSHLNSPDYYSVYPPVCQMIFGASARVCGANILANVVFMRILILIAECGSMALIYRISSRLRVSASMTALYAFNPLVILELAGNLHPEAFMICLLLLAIYLLIGERLSFSALAFGGAVGVKLIPLMLLPLLIRRLGLGRSARYFTIVAASVILLFLPFANTHSLGHFLSSLALYLRVFEFNASVFYIARWIGYQIAGYDTIAVAGLALAAISLALVLAIAYFERETSWKSMFVSSLLCLTVYYGFATTVHPWYLATLIALGAFAGYLYPFAWSFLVIVSYAAYRSHPYSEDLGLVTFEYGMLAICMVAELLWRKGFGNSVIHLFQNFRSK